MIDSPKLLADLQKEVTRLHTDLRARCDAEPSADAPLKSAYDATRAGQRTALTYKAWREEELTNVAVAWVLACVFVRFLEDNALVETLHLAGPDAAGLGRARDQQIVFFREHPGLTEREYLEHVFTETARLPGMADLFDRRHNPLWTVGPTGDAARAFIEFWRKADAAPGAPVHCFSTAEGASESLNSQLLRHPLPRRPLPGPLRSRAQTLRPPPDPRLHRAVHPRPHPHPGHRDLRLPRGADDRSHLRLRPLPARRLCAALRPVE